MITGTEALSGIASIIDTSTDYSSSPANKISCLETIQHRLMLITSPNRDTLQQQALIIVTELLDTEMELSIRSIALQEALAVISGISEDAA